MKNSPNKAFQAIGAKARLSLNADVGPKTMNDDYGKLPAATATPNYPNKITPNGRLEASARPKL